jgi:hypothetical protein
VIVHGGNSTTVNLVDQGGKRLIGKLDGPLERGTSGQDKHGDAITGRL